MINKTGFVFITDIFHFADEGKTLFKIFSSLISGTCFLFNFKQTKLSFSFIQESVAHCNHYYDHDSGGSQT